MELTSPTFNHTRIDEVGFYSPAATPEQIAAIFTAGSDGKPLRDLVLELVDPESSRLVLNATNAIPFRVRNQGTSPVSGAQVEVDFPESWVFVGGASTNGDMTFSSENRHIVAKLPSLNPSEQSTFSFLVRSTELSVVTNEFTATPLEGDHLPANNQLRVVGVTVPGFAAVPSGLVAWWTGDVGDHYRFLPTFPFDSRSLGAGERFVKESTSFNGLDSYIALNTINIVSLSNFTVEAWVRRADPSGTTKAPEYPGATFHGGGIVGADLANWFVGLDQSGRIAVGVGPNEAPLTSVAAVSDLRWRHIAVTRDRTHYRFFLDGQPAGEAEHAEPVPAPLYSFLMGSVRASVTPAGTSNFLSWWGDLDEISIYDRPLAPSEISAIAGAREGGKLQQNLKLAVIATPPDANLPGIDMHYRFEVQNLDLHSPSNLVVAMKLPDKLANAVLSVSTGVVEGEGAARVWRIPFFHRDMANPAIDLTLVSSQPNNGRLQASLTVEGGDWDMSDNALDVSAYVFGTDCGELGDNIVAWYPLNGDASEALGSRAGSPNSVVYLKDRGGQIAYFEGNGSVIVAQSVAADADFTWAVWVRRHREGWQSVAGTIFQTERLSMGVNPGGDFGLQIGGVATTSAPVCTDSAWHYVALVRRQNTLSVLMDGIPTLSAAIPDGFVFPGYFTLGGVSAFYGGLDDLTVYNRAMTPEELTRTFLSPQREQCYYDSAVAFEPFDHVAYPNIPVTIPLKVSNPGAYALSNLTLTLPLPSGAELISGSNPSGSAPRVADGKIIANFDSLPVGAAAAFQLQLRFADAGAQTLTAVLNRSGYEFSTQNNTAIAELQVRLVEASIAPAIAANEGGPARFTVSLNQASPVANTLRIAFADETARGGVDYDSTPLTVTIPAGETSAVFDVQTFADGIWKGSQTFAAILSVEPTLALGNARSTCSISDSSPAPFVLVSSAIFHEVESATEPNEFRVQLVGSAGIPVEVKYVLANGTALRGVNFVGETNKIVFQPGEHLKRIPVSLIHDHVQTPNLTLYLRLSLPSDQPRVFFDSVQTSAVILDGDQPADLKVDHFEWSSVPLQVGVKELMPVTIYAKGADGQVASDFDGEVVLSASPSGYPSSPVLISEVSPTSASMRFVNASDGPVDISGWSVLVFDENSWPGANSPFVLPANTTLAAGATFDLRVFGAPNGIGRFPLFTLGIQNFNWADPRISSIGGGAPTPVGVILASADGSPRDSFFAHPAQPRGVLAPALVPGSFWNGPALVPISTSSSEGSFYLSYQRLGIANTRSAADWVTAPSGNLRTRIKPPLADCSQALLTAPANPKFHNGRWDGEIFLNTALSPMVLRVALADRLMGSVEGLSKPIRVVSEPDLAASLDVSPSPLFYQGTNTIYRVGVTNNSAVPATNVKVVLELDPGLPLATVSVASLPGGTTSVASGGTGAGAVVTGSLPNLPGGGLAVMEVRLKTLPTQSSAGLMRALGSSATVFLAEDANSLNNFARRVDPLRSSFSTNSPALLAYFKGDGNFADEAGLHHATRNQNVGFLSGQTGQAFSFSGDESFWEFPATAPFILNFQKTLLWEGFVRADPFPANRGRSVILESRSTDASGWSLALEEGRPTVAFRTFSSPDILTEWRLGDLRYRSQFVQPPEFLDLRDGTWHHLALVLEGKTDSTIATLFMDALNIYSGEFPFTEIRPGPVPGERVMLRFGGGFQGGMDDISFYSSRPTAGALAQSVRAMVLGRKMNLPDSDKDGLPDVYENQTGTDFRNASDAKSDADGDGAGNLLEFQAGTSPLDPAQSPKAGVFKRDDGSVVIRVFAAHGHTVQLMRRGPTGWETASEARPGQGALTEFVLPSPAMDAAGFYQIAYAKP